MSKFFASVKDKLSRKPSNPSSAMRAQSNNPFVTAPSPQTSSSRMTTSGTTPTRRPPRELPSPANTSEEKLTSSRYLATEAPPAYSESPAVGSSAIRAPSPSPSVISAASLSSPDDPYAFLGSFDTIFVIDDSSSMLDRLSYSGISAWDEVKNALSSIAPICTARDPDGIDVFFLNHKSSEPASKGSAAGGYRGINDAAHVDRLFSAVRPRGATPTGTSLRRILKPYIELCDQKRNNIESVRPINVIVITDGAASDDVESVLIQVAKKLDKMDAPPYQVGVQFFQVGNQPGATEALRELDDGLCDLTEDGIRDMVDTVTWSSRQGRNTVLNADDILKTVLGAVIKRLDRRPGGNGRRSPFLAP